MPELPELLKQSIGDVPPFEPTTLAARERRRRRRQVGAAGALATVVAVMVVALAFGHSDRDRGVSIKTHGGPTTDAPETTVIPSTTGVPTTGDTTTTFPATTGTVLPGNATTTVPAASPPQVGDFSGTLTATQTTVAVGDGIDVDLQIHNASDHAIDTSENASPTSLALYCATPTSPNDGRAGVFYGAPAWFFTDRAMQPGADQRLVGHFEPTADMVGTIDCAAAIVDDTNPMPRFFPSWSAVTAIPTLSITVTPAASTTTSSEPPTSTTSSTTVP